MAGVIRLNIKEASDFADLLESRGTSIEELRATIEVIRSSGNHHSAAPADKISDDEYLEKIRGESYIDSGSDLECMLCHGKFNQLLNGTCESCFRVWALSSKPK